MLEKLYRLIDIESTNQISTNQIMEFISNLTNARYCIFNTVSRIFENNGIIDFLKFTPFWCIPLGHE